jgi:hypothetical protein
VSLSSSYASGEVALASPDAALGAGRYALSGLTDVRLRATGRRVGDGVLLTLGLNVPTGPTSLDPAQLSALRVLAAPALGLQPAAVGTGLAGTSGIVLARTLGDWAWALGASYELRGTYAPVAAFIAGTAEPDFDPGDALHLSLGTDGFLGRHGLTVGVSADFYTEDKLTTGNAGSEATVQLGPIVTAEAQLRLAAGGLRDLTLYAVERYRSSFKRAGETVPGSSGHYTEAGLRGVIPAGRSMGIVAALHGRYHTGLEVDNTLATAAVRTGGATLGVAFDLGRSGTLQPFVRGQLGTIETGGRRTDARGIAAGVVLGVRP